MKRLLILIGFLLPGAARAVSITNYSWQCRGFLYCESSGKDAVAIIATRLVTIVSAFIGALAVVVFIYGAIRMVTSQGDEGKEAGKKALIWASIGLVAAILTGGIVAFINGYLYRVGV